VVDRLRASSLPATCVLVTAPLAELRAAVSSDTEDEVLRRAWWATAELLPGPLAARRLSWSSFVFVTGAARVDVHRAVHDLSDRLQALQPGVRWHVVVVPADQGLAGAVQAAEEAVARCRQRNLRCPVVIIEPGGG
jgi:hypothetical protein